MSDDAAGSEVSGGGPAAPVGSEIPAPGVVADAPDATGTVVWHRKHLRLEDHRSLARAVAEADAVCPLFVFDPSFYGDGGLACDARIRFLHQAVASLDRLYAAAPSRSVTREAPAARERLGEKTPLTPERPEEAGTGAEAGNADGPSLDRAPDPGLTMGFGDPVRVLSAFADRGWSVVTMAAPTSRYGARRDERVRAALGEAVDFVSGDGLVRDREWPRADWSDRVDDWLTAEAHAPDWEAHDPVRLTVETGVSPAVVDGAYGIAPTKTKVPPGTHRAAATRLAAFTERIESYPGSISAPGDARDGTSGLSPYLNFGLLSVRKVYQYVHEHAPPGRGREMFTDRLVWNMHYNQKLADWPDWTERAVNPVLEGFNEERHDPDLVAAWKAGRTGYPMVDASMRCLRETGWLNFRMRAMCASFFTHVLQQPWWIGADWYHHHLIDSDVGINYTQWQHQAGLIGKPSQRVYNPRKQVRDQDPDGEWITEWVPELAGLPADFLDRPERTPVAVQEECGVRVGEDYPYPVVDFEARREAFWSRYERVHPDAAQALARPEVAKRASFSGGYAAARAIAEEHGRSSGDGETGTQASLVEATGDSGGGGGRGSPTHSSGDASGADGGGPEVCIREGSESEDGEPTVPTGAGDRAGEPSPDDRAAVPDTEEAGEDGGPGHGADEADPSTGPEDPEQTSIETFE